MASTKRKVVAAFTTALIGFLAFQGCSFIDRPWRRSPQNLSSASALPGVSSIPSPQAPNTASAKAYSNADLGFEFQYPTDWTIREDSFLNYYSRFNLEVVPPGKIELFDPVLINVVSPEFSDRTFRGLEAITSAVVVGGVSGIKYEYDFEGTPEIDIILPFGQNRMIIGTKRKYEAVFTQIVESFKFLPMSPLQESHDP